MTLVSKRKISIVIPTYNEKDNIEPLLSRVGAVLQPYDYEILIIDDNSSDGTVELALEMASRYPLRVISRKTERGLASAVARGFVESYGEIVGVMDADLQHPPEVLIPMIKAVEKGADVAVASRYIAGGGCQDWSRLRILESKIATLFAHLFLRSARKVKDPMSGYFMVKRQTIDGVDLKPTGYKILLEVLVKGRIKEIAEVPFIFRVRERGSSKLNTRQQVEYLKHVVALMKYSGEFKRIMKYCAVGASGVVVDMGIFWLLTSIAGLFNVMAAALSAETAIITNYTFNNFFTFADRSVPGVSAFFNRLGRFNLVSLSGIGIKLAVFWILTLVFGQYDLVFNLCGIAVATVWNYTVNTWWTWK
jgi:dolichol-phosphate mannosyltransferase